MTTYDPYERPTAPARGGYMTAKAKDAIKDGNQYAMSSPLLVSCPCGFEYEGPASIAIELQVAHRETHA